MKELLRLKDESKPTEEQGLWFRPKKDSIELFNLQNDPYEFHNLAENEKYESIISEMTSALDQWIKDTEDKGRLTEDELIYSLLQNGKQPVTRAPKLKLYENLIALNSNTEGESIGYQWASHQDSLKTSWEVYTKPIQIRKNLTYLPVHIELVTGLITV